MMNKPDWKRIRSILGDAMPDLEPNRVGRFRLLQALKNRFGDNYKSNAAAKEALSVFDSELKYHTLLRKMRGHGNH